MTASPSIPRTLVAPTTQPSSPLTTPLALAGTSLISEMTTAPSTTTHTVSTTGATNPTAQHALTQLASLSQGVEGPPGAPQPSIVGTPPGAVMVRTQYGVQMLHGQRPGIETSHIYNLALVYRKGCLFICDSDNNGIQ